MGDLLNKILKVDYIDVRDKDSINKSLLERMLEISKKFITEEIKFKIEDQEKIEKKESPAIKLEKVNSVINLTGILNGEIILSMEKDTAKKIAKQLFIEELRNVELSVYFGDVMSEMLNVIVGNLTNDISNLEKEAGRETEIEFGTPNLLLGDNMILQFSNSEVWYGTIITNEGKINLYFINKNL